MRERTPAARVLLVAVFCGTLVLGGSIARGAVIHVPSVAAPTIQSGIDASADGDTVLVADGHYYERLNFRGKRILVTSAVLGGGDSSHIGDTIIDGDPSVIGLADTASVVCFVSGEDTTTVLQGFTITNGIGTESGLLGGRIGGGIYCDASGPKIRRCLIVDNTAGAGGGGLAACGSQGQISEPIIDRCTLTGNSSTSTAGAILSCRNAWPRLRDTVTWGDSAPSGSEIAVAGVETPAGVILCYCDVQGGQFAVHVAPGCYLGWGDGNIDCNPVFCDPYEGDYSLRNDSCCAGAGSTGGSIGCFDVGCTIDASWHLERLIDLFYIQRGEPGEHTDREFTDISGVPDGASLPDDESVYFVMDMRGTRWFFIPPDDWFGEIYFFGQIVAYYPDTGDTACIARTPDTHRGPYSLAMGEDAGFPLGTTWWYAAAGVDSLYHLAWGPGGAPHGQLLGSYPACCDSITGLAFDSENGHLWAIARGTPDMLVEYDVSSGTPELIQGPFPVPWPYGHDSGAAAGLDYSEDVEDLVAVSRATGEAVWFKDVLPQYAGPPGGAEPRVDLQYSQLLQAAGSPRGGVIYDRDARLLATGYADSSWVLDSYVALTSVPDEPDDGVPSARLRLFAASPNPFERTTEIRYALPASCHVTLQVFDVSGRKVATLVDAWREAGPGRVRWDAGDVASGIYFCRLEAGGAAAEGKILLLK